MPQPQQAGAGSSPAKVILLGEHSAVYGQPALALPLPTVSATCHVTPAQQPGIFIQSDIYTCALENVPEDLAAIQGLVTRLVAQLGLENRPLQLALATTIPLARGLGSSAAISAAVTRALYDFASQPLSPEETYQHVQWAEMIHHGASSGIDAAVVSHQKTVLLTREKEVRLITATLPGVLLVMDSGTPSATKKSVAFLRQQKQRNPAIEGYIASLGEVADAGLRAYESGAIAELSDAMNRSHTLLQNCGVSSPTLDQLVSVALQNGAVGAKMTGGGQGGCMIALCETQQEAKAVQVALEGCGARFVGVVATAPTQKAQP